MGSGVYPRLIKLHNLLIDIYEIAAMDIVQDRQTDRCAVRIVLKGGADLYSHPMTHEQCQFSQDQIHKLLTHPSHRDSRTAQDVAPTDYVTGAV